VRVFRSVPAWEEPLRDCDGSHRQVDRLLIRTAAGQAGIGNNDGHITCNAPTVTGGPSPIEGHAAVTDTNLRRSRRPAAPDSQSDIAADNATAARPGSPERRPSSRSLLASEELDREPDRPIGLDEVFDVRRDALRPTHLDQHVGDGCRLSHEAQTALIDSQSTPRSACHPVGSAQGVRHGVFIPRHRRSNDLQVGGNVGAIAERACQRCANLLLACDVVDPRGWPQRRPMPDTLTVEAIKHGDPITGVIALEPNDPTLHDPERTECPIPAGIIPSSRALERRLLVMVAGSNSCWPRGVRSPWSSGRSCSDRGRVVACSPMWQATDGIYAMTHS
jgi:hypothetical protein